MAEPIVPPDLIGAGVAQQPQPDQPIRQTTLPNPAAQQMRGMSGLQSGDMSLLSALGAPQPAPNMGLAASAGVLDAMKGVRGPNTYLQQHGQMVDQGQARQMQQVQLMDRMMQRRREQEEKQEAALMTIVEGFKDSDNPGAQAIYGREMATRAKRYGLDITPAYFTQAAKIGKEELDLINSDIVAGLTPDQITARHPKLARLSPNWLKDQFQVLKNPAMRAKLGYKSDEELQVEKVERERKVAEGEIATWRTKHRDIDDKSLPYVAQYVQQYGGMPLIGLDPANPVHQELKTKALAWAREQVRANDTAWQQLEETKRAHGVTESRLERELRLKEVESGGGFGKPLSSAAAGDIRGVVRLSDAVTAIDRIANDKEARKTVDQYIGPYASRYAKVQTLAPSGVLGQVPTEVVDLHQRVSSLKNYTIKLITGAQMSEAEAERIKQELPDVSLPPDQFWRRYENTKKDIARMRQIVDAAIVRGDRRALSVMQEMEGAPPVPPPGPLNPAPTGTRRIRVRDNKTGKLHDAELGPGDMVPPGYTEIK